MEDEEAFRILVGFRRQQAVGNALGGKDIPRRPLLAKEEAWMELALVSGWMLVLEELLGC